MKLLCLCASLLLTGCSASTIPVLDNTNEYVEVVAPKKARSDFYVYGSYNFRDYIDYSVFQTSGSCEVVFSPDDSGSLVSFASSGTQTNGYLYSLRKIAFSWLNGGAYVDVTFTVGNSFTYFDIPIRFQMGESLADTETTYADTIFDVKQQYYLHGVEAQMFDIFFTRENNALTTSYTGYYNFNNGLSTTTSNFFVTGSLIFNNNIYYDMSNLNDGTLGGGNTLVFNGYSVEDDAFINRAYYLPFNNNDIVSSNVYFTGVKMSISSYAYLSNIGVFAYVRDTSLDGTTFKDLLFGVIDAPIYMLSRLLSFELFGVNLFVALTGLLTLACILILIRRFF